MKIHNSSFHENYSGNGSSNKFFLLVQYIWCVSALIPGIFCSLMKLTQIVARNGCVRNLFNFFWRFGIHFPAWRSFINLVIFPYAIKLEKPQCHNGSKLTFVTCQSSVWFWKKGKNVIDLIIDCGLKLAYDLKDEIVKREKSSFFNDVVSFNFYSRHSMQCVHGSILMSFSNTIRIYCHPIKIACVVSPNIFFSLSRRS